MDNYQVSESFSLLARLLDIHGENSFKTKSYTSAAFAIENLTTPLSELPTEKIAAIKGIGASCAQKIMELLETGHLRILDEITFQTPPGVTEMLNIKGLGPKKINTIWKEMEIETIGELLYACKENRLSLFKGFGEKTQQNVSASIEFYLRNKGSFLFAQVENIAVTTIAILEKIFKGKRVEITGAYRRQLPVVNQLEFVVEGSETDITNTLANVEGFTMVEQSGGPIVYKSAAGVDVKFFVANHGDFYLTLLRTSSSESFYAAAIMAFPELATPAEHEDEKGFFAWAGLPLLPAALRENPALLGQMHNRNLCASIQPSDIRGIIHCHSTWSDGSNSLEEMARAAQGMGLEYLVISDHSKSAFYAQGLTEQRIREQHLHIDELNEKLYPFKIFKSIESDILNDGSLDYPDEVLATFDLVIASVHSNLKMTEEKAMSRLLKAIENPYTTILGHMTGRLLLSRPGYPVNHDAIIDACAANKVVIELNAHPNRLDIDWQFIDRALEKNVLISIDPDAHHIDGLDDTRYGVIVAQKTFLTKETNLSSYSREAFEQYIHAIKQVKGLVAR